MSLACNRTEQESHRIVSLELREEVNLNVLKNANPNISMTQKKKNVRLIFWSNNERSDKKTLITKSKPTRFRILR